MPRTIQIRNVPDAIHRRLKARAVLEGMSLSDYLLREISSIMERPNLLELRMRLRKRARVRVGVSSAIAVRRERGRF